MKLRLPAALADSLGPAAMELNRKIDDFNDKFSLAMSPSRPAVGSPAKATADAPRTMCQPQFTSGDRPIDPTRTLNVTTCTKDELELKEFLRRISFHCGNFMKTRSHQLFCHMRPKVARKGSGFGPAQPLGCGLQGLLLVRVEPLRF